MREASNEPGDRRLRVGSLFSGYGGLDLAVEEVFDARTVEPVDVLCGGFPCQDVSTVGKMAGLKPGTRSASGRTWRRTPLASDSARGGETLDRVKARRGTIALSHQVIDLVTRKARQPTPEATFALIEEFFDVGNAMPMPSLDGKASPDGPPPLLRS